MLTKAAISFDDGLYDQFKWARGLYKLGIEGTFYVCPFYIGHVGFLTLKQLKRMHDEWGHVIANHFWLHEAPRGSKEDGREIGFEILRRNAIVAKEWLVRNGFEDGAELLALPFGSVGGGWKRDEIEELFGCAKQIRDVGSGVNEVGSRILTAIESTDVIGEKSGKMICYYFHGNHGTRDDTFVDFLHKLQDSGCEITSMRKEANV